jgi:hypothetical protein
MLFLLKGEDGNGPMPPITILSPSFCERIGSDTKTNKIINNGFINSNF